jgi:CPA2 family monovalent cation:H+ antiporter-2
MRVVARSYSKEIFVATAAALCLGGAATGHLLGFSLALGAFAAGLVISESPYGHELLAKVTPLRDLFGMIFFVSLGLLFDASHVWRQIVPVAVLLICVFVGKAAITTMAAVAGGYHARAALAAGLGLSQIGEFSFLITTIAWGQSVIGDNVNSLIIAVATLSLLVTPLWMHLGHRLYLKMRSYGLQDDLEERATRRRQPLDSLREHVVLCGYGRIGSRVGEALAEQGHPVVVVDYDQHVINALASRGGITVYGDASSAALLAAAGAARARLAVVALPEGASTRLAVRELRRLNPSLHIVARAHSDEEVEAAYREGATRVIYAELEAGLETTRDALVCLGHAQEEVQELIDRARSPRQGCFTRNGGEE